MRLRRLVPLCLLAAWLAVGWHHANKPLPGGTHVASAACWLPQDQTAFIGRLTLGWWDRAVPQLSAARRLNFKSDGRGLIVADDGRGGWVALIGSASLKDAQSAWSNVAVRLAGDVLPALLASELSVARFSGWQGRAEAFAVPAAQLTRRDLDDYDLEANAALELARSSALAQQSLSYFETLWGNRAALGIEYSAGFAAFADPAQSDYWLYRLMEGTGFSPF